MSQADLMDRLVDSLNLRRPHVLHDVAAEYRCAAFVQPLDAGRVKSRSCLVQIERPFFRTRTQRPVRTSIASPLVTRKPAFFSHSSRSSG